MTNWFTRTMSVALPKVYSQLTLGMLRRNTVSRTPCQPVRSSIQVPRRSPMSGLQLHENLAVLDLEVEGVEGSGRRTRGD